MKNHFTAIRMAYEKVMPEIEKDGLDGFDPYFFNWVLVMSPIEEKMWIDIRSSGLTLLPQFPVLGFFLDFADPSKKIAIECDGAKWHDPAKDRIRYDKLIAAGWHVYRLTGRECNAVTPWLHSEDVDITEEQYEKHFMETSTGFIHALKTVLYLGDLDHPRINLMLRTIAAHKS